MGTLIIPSSGSVYVDAQIIIYSVEKSPIYLEVLSPLWQTSRNSPLQIITSELSMLEIMTGPIKNDNQQLIETYEELLTGTEICLIPIDMDILMEAARLRAKTSLRTPDAIHAATALISSCETLITNDLAFRSLHSMNVQILKDIV